MKRFPSRGSFIHYLLCLMRCVTGLLPALGLADEWKPRHELISPTGVLDLPPVAEPEDIFFYGPTSTNASENWRARLNKWRADRLRYDDSEYRRPELEWTQHVFSQVQLLIWDRSFYDPEKREYTVDRFLGNIENRLGPIDAVLIWHVYPNIGADDRNQFDLLRDLPGGTDALRNLVRRFHEHNVRVFFPLLAWDTGTREERDPAWITISRLLNEIGADGINFDTLESVPAQFRPALDEAHPLALEPQFDPRDESLAWTNLAWNDWVAWEGKEYPFVPMVSRSKWLEPRHTVDVTDRFTRDKTNSLQHAFFNGQGYASLENLWGFWYGTTEHDAEAILRLTRIERDFAENLRSIGWEPHTPTLQSGVFASKFPAATTILWTLVNRNEYDVAGEQLVVPYRTGTHYYDLWDGHELLAPVNDRKATLSFRIAGRGFGAVLAEEENPDRRLRDLLAFMAERSKRPLEAYSREWKPTPQRMVEIPRTKLAANTPPGMIRLPEAEYDFQVRGMEIEGGNDPGVDVQYPWEDAPRRTHRQHVHLRSFYMDRTPVTNAEYKKFLDQTGYHPADDHNFLRDWKDGTYREGWANKPVTWVAIEDARAYAGWAGKRLSHEWEWQYAAQSTDGRLYPWGKDWNAQALPQPDHGRSMRPLSDVDRFPQGASPFGILDLEGNVSEWTDEYRDEHTRAAIVRGGAAYQPLGSIWYFPQSYRLDEHQKYLLMSPGRDRAGTIGFRCVVDAE